MLKLVVSRSPHSRARIILLLLALLMTQAASSVCGAQCVERQLPNHTHAMAHCQAMMNHQEDGSVVTTCSPTAHSICGIELLANNHAKSLVMVSSLVPEAGTLPGPNMAPLTPALPLLRSNNGSSPLITALRV